MKKFLSLVLALVMTMSLVTVSAGAKGFTDDSKIQYKEAVDVMSAAKVVDGYSEGDFRPDATLTRGAAAKIICNLILGPTTAAELHADTAPFKDVPVNHTFAGYIAFCAKEGIISGYADGAFRPAATLTSYAFMKMLLGALGYDAEVEQYVGGNWSINVAKRALNIGLDDGLKGDFNGIKSVTREEACLYALNTLTADMVEYDSRTNINVGGAEVIIAGSEAKVMENKGKTDGKVFDKDGEMQFAEMYFDNLSVTKGTDDFARPANVWKNKAEKIGTYADEADLTYTAKVEVGDIYKDLDLGSTVDKKNVSAYVNGVEDEDQSYAIKKGDDKNEYGANGVLTEVFYDNDNDTVTVTMVNTYVGTIAKTVEAKGNKEAYVVVSPEAPINGDLKAPISGNENFETNEKFEDDAYVLYTYSESADEIKSVMVAEKVEGTVTRAENDKENGADSKSLTIDGTKYKDSKFVAGEKLSDVSVKEDYTIYLDSYGYMIYVEENEEIGDYALLLNVADRGNLIGKKAELVFADGTSKVVETAKNYTDVDNLKLDINGDGKINTADQNNFFDNGKLKMPVIVTYKADSDGVYTLRAVDGNKTSYVKDSDKLILKNDKAGVQVNDFGLSETSAITANANSASVFVVADAGSDEDFTAYTGIKNAPSINVTGAKGDTAKAADVYYYCKSGKMISVMFVMPGSKVEIEDDSNNAIFLANESVSNLIHDGDGDYYEFQAVVNGEIKTVKVDENVKIDSDAFTHSVKTLNGMFKSYSTDKYGIITGLKTYDDKGVEQVGDRYQPAESYAGNTDAKEYVSQIGIDKVSKEYTVLLGYNAPASNNDDPTYDYTITVDDKMTVYYVDEDGNITESSYKGIAVDDNDKVYAVVEDYMVQTLVIEEVGAVKATFGVKVDGASSANATVKVDGTKVAAGEAEEYEKGDEDVVITVTPDKGYQIDKVSVDGNEVSLNKDNQYTISKIKKLHTVKVEASKIADATMDVLVTYKTADGASVGTQLVNGITAEAGKSYALLGSAANKALLMVPADYEFVSADEPVAFVANGYAKADVTVEKVAFNVTFTVDNTTFTGKTVTINDQTVAAGATSTIKMKEGDSVTVKAVGGDWANGNGYTITADSNFVVSDRAVSKTSAENDTITVKVTAPELTAVASVTLKAEAM